MTKPLAVRVDEKGRVHLPQAVRKTLHVEPGDIFFVQVTPDGLRLRQAPNPFDALAESAMREADRHETVPLDSLTPRPDPASHDH